MLFKATTWSPLFAIFIMARRLAAWPDPVATAATPPSRAAILFSRTSVVGFPSLV